MKNDYYVYLHKTLDGKPFYVGKGRNKRAWNKSNRSKGWNEVSANGYSIEIYRENLLEEDALELEKSLIVSMPDLVNKLMFTPTKFEDYADYFIVDVNSPSGLSRKQGVFTGTYHKGGLGPCGYKAKRTGGQLFWRIKYKNKSVQVHRIVWEIANGPIPSGLVVDHKDKNSLNNNISNLRLITQEKNCQNRSKNRNNSSGINGVTIDNQSCRASWFDSEGKRRSKRFGIKQFGFDEALRLASEFRKSKETESGYSDNHGT